jgi:hypothetical protein
VGVSRARALRATSVDLGDERAEALAAHPYADSGYAGGRKSIRHRKRALRKAGYEVG